MTPASPSSHSNHRGGILLAAASAACFGLMAIFATQAYDAGLDVPTLLALRFALAAALVWVVVAVRRPARPAGRDLTIALGLGAIGYAMQAGCYFLALTRLDASLTALLLYLYPGMVFAGAVLLGRDRWDRLRLGALGAATGGAVLVLVGGADLGGLDALGVGFAAAATLTYATYILVADAVAGRIDPFLATALVCTGAAMTTGVVAVVNGPVALTLEGLGWIVAITLVCTVAAITLFLLALPRVGAATASIVSTLEPVITVALALLLLGEALTAAQLLGGALVVGAAVVVARVTPHGAAPVTAGRAAAGAPAGEPARG